MPVVTAAIVEPVVLFTHVEPVAARLRLFTIWNDKETSSKHAGVYSVFGMDTDSNLSATKYVWSHIVD